MTRLVFGKSGQVACELQRQADVVALGRDAADLSDPAACAALILAHKPLSVINAAAYTAVDHAETEEALARVVNGDAPAAMARACAELGIPFLHVSTDYVFDGSGTEAWEPSNRVAPQNAYGRSKALGEAGIASAGGPSAILRTSWVFSAHGGNFVKTMLRLSEDRDLLSIVNDQIGGPTSAAAIARALLLMEAEMRAGQSGGTYHFAGAPACSWADFAAEIFAQAGRSVQIKGIASADYPTPATRPLNSRLDCSTLERDFGIAPPDWRNDLADVLKDLGYGAA